MTWELLEKFKQSDIIKSMRIGISVNCTLYGSERYFLRFVNPKLIKDTFENIMQESLLDVKAYPYMYVSASEMEVVSSSGNTFSLSSLITFAIVAIAILFQYIISYLNKNRSAAVGVFWDFISTVQLLSFIPLLNGITPGILTIFINNYLSVTSITFPFELIPIDWINPLYWFAVFFTPPYNNSFFDCGYTTTHFIYNFANQIWTWMLLLLLYIFLIILSNLLPGEK